MAKPILCIGIPNKECYDSISKNSFNIDDYHIIAYCEPSLKTIKFKILSDKDAPAMKAQEIKKMLNIK